MRNVRRDPHTTRIVVTGMGTINPIAYTVEQFWENLSKGVSGIRKARNSILPSEFPVQIGGEVDYPDNLSDFIPKKMINRFSRFIIFGTYAAKQAFLQSGITQEQIEAQPHRYGAIIGTGDAGLGLHYETFQGMQKNGMEGVSPFYVVGVIPNTASAFFAKEYNMQGPNFSVNSACATSNHAIGTAATLIKMGQADVMFAGGAEAVVNIPSFAGFNTIYALSRRNDDPNTASRPFDKDRDGFVLGEGSGVLCLEELEHAKKRGATIYGELAGYGFSCDAYDLVAPHPEGRGAQAAMELALEDAKMNPEEIQLINCHGTSTPVGDISESRAITNLFGEDLVKKIPAHSTKSMLGHLIGAAGGTEAIAGLMAINRGIIHPSINVFEQDPEIRLNVVKNKAREQKVDVVLSNSFGFGGQNSSIILKRYQG